MAFTIFIGPFIKLMCSSLFKSIVSAVFWIMSCQVEYMYMSMLDKLSVFVPLADPGGGAVRRFQIIYDASNAIIKPNVKKNMAKHAQNK